MNSDWQEPMGGADIYMYKKPVYYIKKLVTTTTVSSENYEYKEKPRFNFIN